jgi:DNA-binding CsgD family transcriptional regulator
MKQRGKGIPIEPRDLIIKKWINGGENGKSTHSQIAEIENLNPSTVSKIISRYRKLGFVANKQRTGRPRIHSKKEGGLL